MHQHELRVREAGGSESREHAPLSTLLALECTIAQRRTQTASAGARMHARMQEPSMCIFHARVIVFISPLITAATPSMILLSLCPSHQ